VLEADHLGSGMVGMHRLGHAKCNRRRVLRSLSRKGGISRPTRQFG
jgi:hypothetical protein